MISGICRIRLSLYVLQPFASAEVSHVAVARNVHVAAALTAIYHHPHRSVPDVNPTNNVFGAIDIYPPTAIQTIPTTATCVQKKLSKTQYRVNIAKIVDEAIVPTARVIHFLCIRLRQLWRHRWPVRWLLTTVHVLVQNFISSSAVAVCPFALRTAVLRKKL